MHDHQRQLDAHSRAMSLARIARLDLTAMRFDQMAADREPQAQSAMPPRE
jgi:hypothetical protein